MKTCYVCGANALSTGLKDVPYEALPGTMLVGVKVEDCASCGEHFEHVPAITLLEDALAQALLVKHARLTGPEIRYLRKYLGLSGTAAARKMRVTKETMSRWETGARDVSPQNDLLLRLIVASKMGLQGFQERLDSLATAAPTPLDSTVAWKRSDWLVAS